MISVSTAYDNLIAAGAHYEWRITNGANTWTLENLIDGKLSSSIMERLSIGNCIASQLDLTLWSVTVDTSSPLVLQFRATDGEGTTSAWYTKGTYYIDTVETSPYSEDTKITAFDAMLKTEVTFMVEGTWTTKTAAAVVGLIATEIGVSVESSTWTYISTNPINLVNSPEIGENGTTDREVLSYIGSLYGGNWRINSANQLQLIRLDQTPSNVAAVGDAVVEFDASPDETISKIRLWVSSSGYFLSPPLPLQTHTPEDILTHGGEAIQVYATLFESYWNQLSGAYLEANIPFWGSQAVAESLYAKFSGKTYKPFTATNAYCDPKYEIGDGITIKDVTSIIASQELTIDQLSPSDISLEAQEVINSQYPYISKEVRSIQFQISQNTALAEAAQKSANGASYRQQTIYKSAASGTITMDAETTWVTDSSGQQGEWTTVRPVYNSSYPVLFVAVQSQNVSQSGGTTCSCSTPAIDQTTTVIDGGHISTGTIDAGVVNVTNLNASNISTGTLSADRIGANTIAVSKLTGSITNGSWSINLDNGTMTLGTLAVGSITGSLSGGLNNSWNINFTNGTMTIGNISASNITTGTLNVGNITITGTISDTGNKNTWNLSTGVLTTTQGKLGGWDIDSSGLHYSTTSGGETQVSNLYPNNLELYNTYSGGGYKVSVYPGAIDFSIYDSGAWVGVMNISSEQYLDMVYGAVTVGEADEPILMLFEDNIAVLGDLAVDNDLTVSGSGGNVLLIH